MESIFSDENGFNCTTELIALGNRRYLGCSPLPVEDSLEISDCACSGADRNVYVDTSGLQELAKSRVHKMGYHCLINSWISPMRTRSPPPMN